LAFKSAKENQRLTL
jgi:hypothetical protein